MRGPMPSENSITATPHSLASRKCPNSWNRISMLKIRIAIMMFNQFSFQSLSQTVRMCSSTLF